MVDELVNSAVFYPERRGGGEAESRTDRNARKGPLDVKLMAREVDGDSGD